MKRKRIDAVAMKRRLQKRAEQKLAHLSEREQLALLHRKFGRKGAKKTQATHHSAHR